MITLSGYKIKEEIHRGSKTIIYKGTREHDSKDVVVKVSTNDFPTPRELTKFQQEYEISQAIPSEGVVQSYALEKYNNGFALILEDFGGVAVNKYLAEQKIDLENFLKLSLRLVETLGEIHEKNIIHKDIKPANIILNPSTFQVKITDFGISTMLSRETQAVQNPDSLEGTLAYMSPEQTGRMNRIIDYRSDFYSLGVFMYEILTGVLPFRSKDAMELVHSHIAKRPESPHLLKADIPEAVSGIVLKLLSKRAEERYQSAYGLKIDLQECLEQLQTNGKIKNFEPGQKDFTRELQIAEKLYGREVEILTLLEHFERVSEGTTELMLVAGYSGIGKSVLVNEIHKPIVQYRGYFVAGKFEQYKRDIPYSAIIQAFQELIREILTESKQHIEIWKEKILKGVGQNGQIIIDVIHEVEYIIGKQPPVPELGPAEAKDRFLNVIQDFIRVFAIKEHPLALFLDDMQWSDSSTQELLQSVMGGQDTAYLLIICAYRDNEVDDSHPFIVTTEKIKKTGANIGKINLKPLELKNVQQLVSDALHTDPDQILELSEIIQAKTAGNPFFVNEFLKTLYQESLINFDESQGNWTWELSKISEVGITNNVVELMAGKIQKLADETVETLRLASCVGSSFALKTLAIVAERSFKESAANLWPAVQEGLIIPLSDSYRLFQGGEEISEEELGKVDMSYRFLHDRVQQAAYSLISEEDKQKVHLKVGRLLWKGTSNEELEDQLFDIVGQLNHGIKLITDLDERLELAKLNLSAAVKAKASAAFGPALTHIKTSIMLLPEDGWSSNYELLLSCYQEAVENTYLNADLEGMEDFANTLLKNATSPLDKVAVYKVRMQRFTSENKMWEAVLVALEILRELGVKIPKKTHQGHIVKFLLRAIIAQRGRKIESLIELPDMSDKVHIAAMEILMALLPPAYISSQDHLALAVLSMVYLSLKSGLAPASSYAFTVYGFVFIGQLQLLKIGLRYGQLGLKVVDKLDARHIYPKSISVFHHFIAIWNLEPRPSIEALDDGLKVAQEYRDYEYYSWNSIFAGNLAFVTGVPLVSLEERYKKGVDLLTRVGQTQGAFFMKPIHQMCLNILEQSEDPLSMTGESFNEEEDEKAMREGNNITGLFHYYHAATYLYLLVGDFEKALPYAEKAEKDKEAALAMPIIITHSLYYSLVLLGLVPAAGSGLKRKYLRKVNKLQRQVQKVWMKVAPINFTHIYHFIEGEKNRVIGNTEAAITHLETASEWARKYKYIHHYAMINERLGYAYASSNKELISNVYLQEAHRTFSRYGATLKINALEQTYPFLKKSGGGGTVTTSETTTKFWGATTSGGGVTTTTGSSGIGMLDISTVMKSSQAISGEIQLEGLLEKLMQNVIENAGAQRGLLFLTRGDELVLQAEGEVDNAGMSVMQSIAVDDYKNAARTVINYVERTKENLVLGHAAKEDKFSNDPYIQKVEPKSLLCAPIINQGKLTGIVYLENNLTTDAFTPDRLEILNLMSSQAAISLENASLYANLEEKVEERTAELQASKKEIDDIMENVNQGLMTVHPDGTISSEYSQKVAEIFERNDIGDMKFENLFRGDEALRKRVSDYLDQLFHNPFMSDKIFATTNPLREHYYTMVNRAKKEVTKVLVFGFSRIYARDENDAPTKEIQKVMVVLDDKTDEFALKKELEAKAEEQANKVEKLYQILQLQPGVFSGFITESTDALDGVYSNLKNLGEDREANKKHLQVCFREVHTLKGNARALNLDSIGKTAHELEDVFEELKENPEGVTPELKEKVFAAVTLLKDEIHDGNSIFEKILNMQQALQVKSQDTMSEFESRFRGIVDKESNETGKEVNFIFNNKLSKPLDGQVVIKLRNPLSHIVRNSLSHGIEPAEERKERFKDPVGKVTLTLTEKEGFLYITCEDDGTGLQTDKIKNKAVKMGLITPEQSAAMTESDVHKMIFTSGLSTADRVSDISGRGVGMDAVKEDLKALGAVILVSSKPGQYARFTIKIPDKVNESSS